MIDNINNETSEQRTHKISVVLSFKESSENIATFSVTQHIKNYRKSNCSLARQTFRGGEGTSGDCSRLTVCNRGML